MSMLSPPTLGERHRGLAYRLVTVYRCAVFVVTIGERPMGFYGINRESGVVLA
jgi:hypothetical protein